MWSTLQGIASWLTMYSPKKAIFEALNFRGTASKDISLNKLQCTLCPLLAMFMEDFRRGLIANSRKQRKFRAIQYICNTCDVDIHCNMSRVFMKYTGTSTRASCHVFCIKHEDFSCYNVFYITTTPYLPCNKNKEWLLLHACNLDNGI